MIDKNIFDKRIIFAEHDRVGVNTLLMEENQRELKRYLELL